MVVGAGIAKLSIQTAMEKFSLNQIPSKILIMQWGWPRLKGIQIWSLHIVILTQKAKNIIALNVCAMIQRKKNHLHLHLYVSGLPSFLPSWGWLLSPYWWSVRRADWGSFFILFFSFLVLWNRIFNEFAKVWLPIGLLSFIPAILYLVENAQKNVNENNGSAQTESLFWF